MYLKHLEIHGFKTFAEKTQIVFTPGITCVIGPNGAGKSNISDAICWVLGENNVRSLRGSSAQDVIFAGNDKRRPLGMAEVSLTIDNSARILPLDFSEITVTRRLFRSGDSEFFINRVACRLRDLYELFLDTGVGRDAYSLINQGEIDQILSVRAEDRREIFEEAAGIKKYRVRKREAERKLEHTQQNLLRVHDIVTEIEAQLGPLQRQASSARRYRELAGRLRSLENAWYGSRLKRLVVERTGLAQLVAELAEERKRMEGELAAAQEEERAAREALQELDSRAERLRSEETAALQRAAAGQAERARAEERAGEVERRLQHLERELAELSERIAEQVRRSETVALEEAGLRREVDGLRDRLMKSQAAAQEASRTHELATRELEQARQASLARARRQAEQDARLQSTEQRVVALEQGRKRSVEALEDGEAELSRLQTERESFRTAAEEQEERAQALGKEAEALRQTAQQTEQALAPLRSALDAAGRLQSTHQARLQALSELGERGEGAGAGAKLLLAGARRGQVKGNWSLLMGGFGVPEGLEKAVEGGLGIYGDALLCERPEDVLPALRWLRSQKATALILPALPSAEPPLPGSLGELVTGPPESAAVQWASTLLARTFLTDSLEGSPSSPSLFPFSSFLSPHHVRVTRDGEWISGTGAVCGGLVAGSGSAFLTRRRELERLEREIPEREKAAEDAREALRIAEQEARRSQTAAREQQSAVEKTRLEHQAQLREADRRHQDVERARHRMERLRLEAERSEREHAASLEALQRARTEREADRGGSGGTPDADADLAAGLERVRGLDEARRAADVAVTDLRVRQAQQEQRLQAASGASRRALDSGASLDRQRSDRLNEQRTLTAEREQGRLSFGGLERELTDADAAVEQSRVQQQLLALERVERITSANVARGQAQDRTARLRELMERGHRAQIELTAVDTQRQHLGRQWLDAAAGAHSLEALTAGEDDAGDEPLSFTVESLLATWNHADAEQVLSGHSDPEGEISRLRRQIRSLGAINPDAVEQYAEAQQRYDFLTSQRADLDKAREQLEEAIREIDTASRDTFMKAFREIAAAFDEMFQKLFGGGKTELRLTDPDDVLETGIDIVVQPPGKKQQNLLLLSGGERALTAAAMLFALLEVRPSPFCVMDEVDAPLDESNVGRFSTTLREFADRTQFIVVTHNRGTMEAADMLYGVTMAERGVSKILSCTLADPVVREVEAEQRAAVA